MDSQPRDESIDTLHHPVKSTGALLYATYEAQNISLAILKNHDEVHDDDVC